MVSDGRFLQRNTGDAGNSSIGKLINGSLSGTKWKKKEMQSLTQVTMESRKAEPYPESVGVKMMQMNGHRYKAIFKNKRMELISGVKRKTLDASSYMDKFKKRRIRGTLSDDEKLEASDVPSLVGIGDGRAIDFEQEGENKDTGGERSGSIVEQMRVELVDRAFDGATERCISIQKGSHVDPSENGISVGHSVKDKPLEPSEGYGHGDKKSLLGAGILTNCSTGSTELPESPSLTALERSLGGGIDLVNSEKHVVDSELEHTSMDAGKDVRSEVADTAPSSLHELENDNRLALHVECTEERRTISIGLDMDEPKERIALSDEQRSSQRKQARKDKVSGSETNDKIKNIQEKCDRWMKKLVHRQSKEIQDFRRIWEEERLELENDHKLEMAFIRCIYGEGSTRINKLKLLDKNIAKKIEEHKLLKDMNLKHLKEKQLAVQKDKREKVAYLLAKAKACYRSQSVDNPCLLGSQSVDMGHPQAIGHLTASDPRDVDSSSEQHNKEEIHDKIVGDMQGEDVLPSNTFVSVSAKAVECTVPTETVEIPLNIMLERTVHNETTSVVAVEQPTESNPLAYGERVSDIIPSSDQSKKVVTQVLKTGNTAIEGHYVESPDALLRVNNRVDASFPENLSKKREATDGVRLLLPLEKTVASPDQHGLTPHSQVVQQEECHRCSAPGKLQDQDAPGTKDPCTISVTDASLEAVVAATTVQSNHEVIKNCEPQQAVSAYVSAACNPAAVSEVEQQPQDKAGSSSQIPEASLHLTKELEGPSCRINSQIGRNMEPHSSDAHADPTLDRQIKEPAEAFSVRSNDEVIENCENVKQVSDVSPCCDQVSAGLVEHQTQDEVTLHLTELEPVLNQATNQSGGNLKQHPAVATVELTSLRCNQVSASEVECQAQDEARSSSHIAVASLHLTEELESLPFQANSRRGEILELHPPAPHVVSTPDGNHLGLGSANRVDNKANGELNVTSNLNFTMARALASTAELPNQACLLPGDDFTQLQEPSNLLIYPSSTVGSLNPIPSCHTKPLEDELHRLRKEKEEAIKVHEDEKSQMKFQCKEEIQEITAQIHEKYSRKLQDAVVAYRLRKSELANNYNKVFMNKILAQSFQSECSTEHPGTWLAMQSFYMQHLNRLSVQSSVRPSPELTAYQPTSSHHATAPNVQPMQVSQSHTTRPSNFAGFSLPQPVQPLQRGAAQCHNIPNRAPHIGTLMPSLSQPVQLGVARPQNFPSRPPHIGTLVPSTFNLRVSEATHSPAPHLQAFRPAASTSVTGFAAFPPIVSGQLASVLGPADYSSFSQCPPQQETPPVHQPLPRAYFQTPQPVFSNFVSHGLLVAPSSSQFTQELQMHMDDQPRVQGVPGDVVYLSD